MKPKSKPLSQSCCVSVSNKNQNLSFLSITLTCATIVWKGKWRR